MPEPLEVAERVKFWLLPELVMLQALTLAVPEFVMIEVVKVEVLMASENAIENCIGKELAELA